MGCGLWGVDCGHEQRPKRADTNLDLLIIRSVFNVITRAALSNYRHFLQGSDP